MEEEKWLPVVGYEGLYEVSDFGRVRSLDRTVDRTDGWPRQIRGKIKRLFTTFQGYLIAHLSRDNKQISRGVHRLVLTAFVGPPPFADAEVNHKDFDKSNNRPDNLEWVTHQENMDHACADGRARPIMGKKKYPKYSPGTVEKIRSLRVEGLSAIDISSATGVTKSTVWKILSNKTWATPSTVYTPNNRASAATNNGRARKLSLGEVDEIRALYAAGGVRQVDLAKRFDVWQGTISCVVRGSTWSDGIPTPSSLAL